MCVCKIITIPSSNEIDYSDVEIRQRHYIFLLKRQTKAGCHSSVAVFLAGLLRLIRVFAHKYLLLQDLWKCAEAPYISMPFRNKKRAGMCGRQLRCQNQNSKVQTNVAGAV